MRGVGVLVIVGWLCAPSALWAQSGEEQVTEPVEAEGGAAVNNGAISLEAGLDYTSMYIFRGLVAEDEGVILWPWLEVTFTLFEGSGALDSIGLLLGSWNSLHFNSDTGTGDDSATRDPRPWFEADAYAGLIFGLIDALEISAEVFWYVSPNGSFATLKELDFGIGYDDSGLLSGVGVLDGFFPHVGIAVELEGGGDAGDSEGTYFEVGIEPTLSFGPETFTLSLAIPLTVGLSLSNYYEVAPGDDETFGFFDAGLVLGIPLVFIPERYGEWSLAGNFHATVLGENAKTISGADDTEMWGGAGISFSY